MDYRPPGNGSEMNHTGRFLLLLLCLTQDPAWAQQEPLGRLFLSPQQRAALDRQRQLNPSFNPNTADNDAGQTLNGEVRLSNGRRTRWVNGEVDWNNSAPAPRVPVGDTFHPSTGERESLLGGGRIIVNRGQVKP